jgi:hypothetical protein
VDAQELKGIEDLHYPDKAYTGKYCQACGTEYGRWPCDARALLDEVNAQAARLAAVEQERDRESAGWLRCTEMRLAAEQERDAMTARLAELAQLRRFGLDDIKTMCGIISHSGPHGEPLACGYQLYHDGAHSWATLPTFGAVGEGQDDA